jgi:3-deoxy-D-manno-octulosonic-acid transferase
MTPARWLYSVVFVAATPLILLYLLYRSIRQPEYRQHWSERFACFGKTSHSGLVIWVHAVSVGETRGAQALVQRLRSDYPAHSLLLTHTTPTGRAVSEELFGRDVERCYLPYDFPFTMRRFLAHYQPALCVLMETELWPNLLNECARRGVPVVLANARLSPRSLAKSLRFARLARPAVAQISRILAQTEADAQRFRELGAATLSVTGNIKFDAEVPPSQLALGARFRDWIGARPVFLCASTRDGEEALILDALAADPLPADTLVVIVPRHPQRFDDVAQLLRLRGMTVQRRSEARPIEGGTRVLLGDSMGELLAFYRCADIAYVGGGLLPFGTHNLIEACAVGCPVLLGPHTFNFAEAAEGAIAQGAARSVVDAADLVRTASRLLDDAALRTAMAQAALRFAEMHRGATRRTLDELKHYLAPH